LLPTSGKPPAHVLTRNSFPNSGGGLQEADETQLWLELLCEECGIEPSLTQPIEQEADELIAIITTMIRRTDKKN